MELTLEHLAPYYPYDLQMYGASYSGNLSNRRLNSEMLRACNRLVLKPILRPLSDLKGNTTMQTVIKILGCSHQDVSRFWASFENPRWSVDLLEYKIVKLLLKQHFDVFGLIEAGLAIDKNTLKN